MSHTRLSIIVLITLLLVGEAQAATKLFEYGFEDWGGTIATSPAYPFGSVYGEFCEIHEASSEVVTAYDGHSPNAGSYFWLGNHTDSAMVPAVSGITAGNVNGYCWLGGGSHSTNDACGDDSFSVTSIATTICFLRFYVFCGVSWDNVDNNDAKLKFVRYYQEPGVDVMWMIYQKAGGDFDDRPEFAIDGPGAAHEYIVVNDFDDGNWHRVSMYVNYSNGVVAMWYDEEAETLQNALMYYDFEGDDELAIQEQVRPNPIKLIGNWSSNNPSSLVYFGIDDIEVWDGIPGEVETLTPPTNFQASETE